MILEYPKIIALFMSLLDIWAFICMWSRLSTTADSTPEAQIWSVKIRLNSLKYFIIRIYIRFEIITVIWYKKIKIAYSSCIITKNSLIKIINQQINHISKSFKATMIRKRKKLHEYDTSATYGRYLTTVDKRSKLSGFKNSFEWTISKDILGFV